MNPIFAVETRFAASRSDSEYATQYSTQETLQAASLQWIFFASEVCRPATKVASIGFSPKQRAKYPLISPLDPVPDTISVSAQH